MRTACALIVIGVSLMGSACGPSESGARPGSGPAPKSASAVRELDPASGIKGVIAFGDAPDAAERAFGKPDRSETSRMNGKDSLAYGYDGQGLYLLFVDGGLERILVTSGAFHLPVEGRGALGVGSTFREVDAGCPRGRWYAPGATGVYPFEVGHNHTLAGRLYLTDGGCAYSFLAPSPSEGNAEGGSDERVGVIVLAMRM